MMPAPDCRRAIGLHCHCPLNTCRNEPTTRFPYQFTNGGPTTPDGIPVIHAPRLNLNPPWALMVVRSVDLAVAYTNDPAFEWAYYRAECHDQARKIVRDGLRKALPWLRTR